MNQIFIIIFIIIVFILSKLDMSSLPNIILIGIILYAGYVIIFPLVNINNVHHDKVKSSVIIDNSNKYKTKIVKHYVNKSSNIKNFNNILRNNNKNIFN
jgi:hypothetical protein